MKLFQSTRKTFAILGISSNRRPFNATILTIFASFMILVYFYIVFLLNIANTFKEYTDSIYLTASSSIITFSYMVFVYKMKKMFEIIDRFEKFIDARLENSKASEVIYVKTNGLVEKMGDISYTVIVKTTPLIWVMPKCFGSLFFYFTTDLGNEALELPLPSWCPFDFKNLTNYLIAVGLQYTVTLYTFIVIAGGISFATGGFLFAVSVSDDIKGILKSINKDAKSKKSHLKTFNAISNFIQIHSTLKQFVQDFVGIFQPVFIAIFVWSVVTICGTMLMFQVELSLGKIDSVVLFVTIFYASYAFGLIGIVCELGQRMTNAFEEIEDVIGKFNWYLFPDKLKVILPTIISVSQQPVDIECFGSITCSRFSFKKVMNSSYSYFTVLRQFND